MRIFKNIFLFAFLLLISCTRGEFTDLDYIRIQREKVAAALGNGVNSDALQPLVDSIKAGRAVLHPDFSLDVKGAVKISGEIDYAILKEKVELLDGTMEVERYREILDDAGRCIRVNMIYDGNSSSPAASIVLGIKRLRDSFGEYLSYQPFFLFRSGVSISIKDFFNSDEFDEYREPLTKLLNVSLND